MSLEVGKSYNFETYATALLGTAYKGVTVEALMNYTTALKERDVTATHHQIFASLPSGTPDDPEATLYVKLKLPSGVFTILGMSWIKLDTVEEVGSWIIDARIYDVTQEDVVRIRDTLALAGYGHIALELTTLARVDT